MYRLARLGCLTGLCLASAVHVFAADSWPSKPVTIVVPFAAGGSTDVTARMLAGKLRAEFGQSFVVENRAGAGGNIGAEYASKARADGYILFLATSSNISNMSLYRKLSFDMIRDFVAVSQVAFIPNVLVVNSLVPATNLGGFVKYVRDPKNNVIYGSAGSGSSVHLAAALFNKLAGGHMMHAPYKGSAPALVDLLGGHIHVSFPPFVDGLPHIKSGKLRAFGMTTRSRSSLMPDVPAIGEVLPGYEVALWNGIFAPAKTPTEIVNRLNAAIVAVVRQADTQKLLAEQGSEPVGSSTAEFKEFTGREMGKWRALVELSGARVE